MIECDGPHKPQYKTINKLKDESSGKGRDIYMLEKPQQQPKELNIFPPAICWRPKEQRWT